MQLNSMMKVLAASWLSILAFSSVAAAGESAPKLKRVGYFTEWGVYERNYEIADVPADQLTHLMYAFAVINPVKYECEIFDSWAAVDKVFPAKNGLPAQNWDQSAAHKAGSFGRIQELKKLHPQLKVLLSVGGWTKSSEFSAAVLPEHRQHFVDSCVAMMNQYGFDGLDFDWEFPVKGGLDGNDHRPEDKHNFTLLLQDVKNKLKAGQEVTLAVTPNISLVENLEVAEINKIVDAIHVMNYDYHGSWNDFTGHLAPLYPADPDLDTLETDADRIALTAGSTIQAFLDAGASPARLVMGVPFYGRAWMAPAHSERNGLYEAASGQVASMKDGNWENGYFDYWGVQKMLKEGKVQSYYDSSAHAPYVYSKETGLFISYDTPASIKEKVDYVKTKGLGGVMFWSLDGDVRDAHSPESLVHVINQNLP